MGDDEDDEDEDTTGGIPVGVASGVVGPVVSHAASAAALRSAATATHAGPTASDDAVVDADLGHDGGDTSIDTVYLDHDDHEPGPGISADDLTTTTGTHPIATSGPAGGTVIGGPAAGPGTGVGAPVGDPSGEAAPADPSSGVAAPATPAKASKKRLDKTAGIDYEGYNPYATYIEPDGRYLKPTIDYDKFTPMKLTQDADYMVATGKQLGRQGVFDRMIKSIMKYLFPVSQESLDLPYYDERLWEDDRLLVDYKKRYRQAKAINPRFIVPLVSKSGFEKLVQADIDRTKGKGIEKEVKSKYYFDEYLIDVIQYNQAIEADDAKKVKLAKRALAEEAVREKDRKSKIVREKAARDASASKIKGFLTRRRLAAARAATAADAEGEGMILPGTPT